MTLKRGSDAATRLRWMHDQLLAAYGPQSWWPAESPFEVIVGAYLTQNTAWRAVELSLNNLRDAGLLNLEGIRAVSPEDLMRLIRPSGFATRKASALKAFAAMLDTEFTGSLDALAAEATANLRKRLLALPGVGPETADAILLYALHHAVPVADEYLRRIVARHGLVNSPLRKSRKDYELLVQLERRAFSAELEHHRAGFFNEFHALTVAVGKNHCRRTPHCENCPLVSDLGQVGGRPLEGPPSR